MKRILLIILSVTALHSGLFAQNSIKFDGAVGTDVIVDSTKLSWSGLTSMTYTMWAKGDWSQGNNYIFDIADANGYNNGSNAFRYGVYEFNGNFGVTVFFNGRSASSEINANQLPTNEWFHVAATVNRTQNQGNFKTFQLSLFINGEQVQQANLQVNSATVSELFLSQGSNIRLGSRFTATANSNLNGNIDQLIFYNRALSQAEITEMVCNDTKPSNGQILYYNFNSGSGNTVYDLSNTGANGTMSRTVAWDNEFVNELSKAPAADFNYSTIHPSLDVMFRDSSSAAVSYKWMFGDGDSSVQRNPNHTYAKEGTYQVSLTTTDICGKVSPKKLKDVVVVCPAAKATFISVPTDRKIDVEANKLGVTKFTWNYGDGTPLDTSSTLNKSSHIYANYGTYNVCLYVESPCGMDTLCEEITLNALGIAKNNMTNLWSVYPNPASTQLNIQIQSADLGSVDVIIRDLQGRVVMQSTIENERQTTLDISGYESGVYSIELRSENDWSTKKFMVD